MTPWTARLEPVETLARGPIIPAGWTPEDWAAIGPQIMAQLKAELAEFDRRLTPNLFADPTVHEPTQDPDDDTEAEVPDAREDPVPE